MRLQKKPFRISSVNLYLTLFSFIVLLKLGYALWLSKLSRGHTRKYSYIGNDYPERWPIERSTVLMASDASNRYQFNTTDGKAEWASLVPGDGVVHLGKEQQPYTLSMVHQLRCLNILRAEIVRDRSTPGPGEYTELARHCLNYIKQMMLCRADAYLEPFWYDNHNGPIDLYSFYECKDWGAVYGEIKKNQEEYIKVAER